MFDTIRYLLLQVRNADDPMRRHEVSAFARALDAQPEQIGVFDLLDGLLQPQNFEDVDVFLLGGSGDYSAAGEGAWLDRALESLRRVHDAGKPTFASCWGFQALARALGGRVIKDLSRAEVGTHELFLTDAGRDDPVFGPLAGTFYGQMGHEDCVVELPSGTTLLAYSNRAEHQAYRFDDAPIYCTQFHPELNADDLLQRVRQYPSYIERIAGRPIEDFPEMIHETLETEALLKRFVAYALGE